MAVLPPWLPRRPAVSRGRAGGGREVRRPPRELVQPTEVHGHFGRYLDLLELRGFPYVALRQDGNGIHGCHLLSVRSRGRIAALCGDAAVRVDHVLLGFAAVELGVAL